MQGFIIQSFREPPIFKWAMIVCFAASLALIAAALWLWGAVEVRGEFGEVFGLTFFGFFWIAILSLLFPWLGLSIEQDIGASRNPAALVALFGAVLALATIYAAGSLGEGPSYWNNIFSAALGTAAFFALWLVLELGGRMSASIAEERDLGSGSGSQFRSFDGNQNAIRSHFRSIHRPLSRRVRWNHSSRRLFHIQSTRVRMVNVSVSRCG